MDIEKGKEILNIAAGKKEGLHVYQDQLNKAIETVLKELDRLEKENKARIIGRYGDITLDELLKDSYVSKDKIREIIRDEFPDEETLNCVDVYDVNGVTIFKRLKELLEEN